MRKKTEEAIENFYKKKNWNKKNTEVRVMGENVFLLLNNNKIAHLFENGNLFITTSGWNTKTTLEILRGFNINISFRKNILLLNEKSWDGEWIKIN
jgi:hypothetical protein